MTREELRDYVDEQRTLNNIPYHVYSTLIDGIDTLEQEPILDIRAEIEGMTPTYHSPDWSITDLVPISEVLKLVDKYKTESEDKK